MCSYLNGQQSDDSTIYKRQQKTRTEKTQENSNNANDYKKPHFTLKIPLPHHHITRRLDTKTNNAATAAAAAWSGGLN